MENLVIEGIITTTSNKQSDQFTVNTPQKTAYLELDEKNAKALEGFGLQKYTSNDGVDFHCVKIVTELKQYFGTDKEFTPLDSSTDAPNFKTGKKVKMNIIKGNKNKNDFYRLQAILLSSPDDIELIEAENPFA